MAELSGLGWLPRIGLAEVLAAAAATTRVDRKYLVTLEDAESFLDLLPRGLRLLDVEGRLTTAYRTTYFDTLDLATCRSHVQGRRRRWKARSRLYVEDQLCRLELKVRDGSGLTRKVFHPVPASDHGRVTLVAEEFFRAGLQTHGLDQPGVLEKAVDVTYDRATLADPGTGSRVTIDLGVRGTRAGSTVQVDPGLVIVETKGGPTPGSADRLLTRLGARPTSFSKYVATASLLDPRIADNDVRHLVGRELLVTHPVPHDLRRTA